jgi:hypothetical protein
MRFALQQGGFGRFGHGADPLPAATAFFSADPMLTSGWEPVSGPSAFYDSATDRTYVAWQFVGVGSAKGIHIAYYDHTLESWSARYTVGNFDLADDDHGHPAIVKDADGYLHCFFGVHNNLAKYSTSTAPDDISAWTQNADAGPNQSYPKLSLISGSIYWMFRDGTVSTRRKLSVRSGTPAAGVYTPSALIELVDFGASSRVYHSEAHVVGTDIHVACAFADDGDTYRTGVYYVIYKTATGALTNYDGSTSVASGSLPISLATANSSFRVFDHGSGDGDLASLQFDSSGNAHLLFADNENGATYYLKHMWLNAGTWTTPENLGAITDLEPSFGYTTSYCLVPGAAGTMQAWYANSNGDKVRRIYGGAWGSEQIVIAKGSHDLVQGRAVQNAHADLRVFVSERLGNVTDSNAVPLDLYAYGDSGSLAALDMTASDANWADVTLLMGFESKDAATSAIDESPASLRSTFFGNAQIDTAQQKYGNASLLLDGTGDYISIPDSAGFKVTSGDMTFEAWIRIATTGSIRAIATKRTSGGTPGEWAFYVSAANVLQLLVFNGATVAINIVGTTALTTGTWYYAAFTRSGTTWSVQLDSSAEGSAAEGSTPTANTNPVLIGRDPSNTGRDFNGWIDEVRFTGANRTLTPPGAAFPRK